MILFFFKKNGLDGIFFNCYKVNLFSNIFLLYIVLRFLIEKNIISLKVFFFISCSFSVFFVSFDIFLQFVNGKDILGFVGQGRKLAGPFGTNKLQVDLFKHSVYLHFFYYLYFFTTKFPKNFINLLFQSFLSFFIGLIIAGNRMPRLIFLFYYFFSNNFQKQTRKFLNTIYQFL